MEFDLNTFFQKQGATTVAPSTTARAIKARPSIEFRNWVLSFDRERFAKLFNGDAASIGTVGIASVWTPSGSKSELTVPISEDGTKTAQALWAVLLRPVVGGAQVKIGCRTRITKDIPDSYTRANVRLKSSVLPVLEAGQSVHFRMMDDRRTAACNAVRINGGVLVYEPAPTK